MKLFALSFSVSLYYARFIESVLESPHIQPLSVKAWKEYLRNHLLRMKETKNKFWNLAGLTLLKYEISKTANISRNANRKISLPEKPPMVRKFSQLVKTNIHIPQNLSSNTVEKRESEMLRVTKSSGPGFTEKISGFFGVRIYIWLKVTLKKFFGENIHH